MRRSESSATTARAYRISWWTNSLCESVFVNLIHNAYQAMDAAHAGGTPASGSCDSGLRPNPPVAGPASSSLWKDTGPGVPAELREQIFNPFYTSKKDGVGLGLAIVAKIVDGHRGWIKLDDNSPQRRAFRVFLPSSPA